MAGPAAWRNDEVARNDRALLRAAREVVGEDGAHASVAAIAARAGVGVGTLYRRYRTKEELFRRLLEIANAEYLAAAEAGLAADDPWEGLVGYALAGIRAGSGSLAPLAGTIDVPAGLTAADDAVAELVARAHRTGVLREGVTAADLELLIEQLSRSPMVDQLRRQGRADLEAAALAAHERIVRLALDGLRAVPGGPAPGEAPDHTLFTERWRPPAPD